MGHDELFKINKIIAEFNKEKSGVKTFSKESIFTDNSYLYSCLLRGTLAEQR